MSIKLECASSGFEDNWIELDMDKWSLRETRELDEADIDGMVRLLRKRTLSCHIELTTGEILTGPSDFTSEDLLDVDEIVLGWLGGCFHRAIGLRRTLGNLSARPSSATSEVDALQGRSKQTKKS